MKILLRILCVCSLTAIAVLTTQAQPANDNFANAWTLTGPSVTTNGSTAQPSNATKEPGEPNHAGLVGGRSVWFNWTAPADGLTRIQTVGSGFNTLLGVYTGRAVGALSLVASNDNIAPGGGLANNASRVFFNATQGTVYRIAIDGRNNNGNGASSGNYVLNLQMLPSVVLVSPTNGSIVPGGTPIPLMAEASSPNGPITSVDFYHQGILIATDSAAPYSTVASNAPLGTNIFFAVATDSAGQVTTSAVVRVAVLNFGITIVSPMDGAIFIDTSPINVSAVELLQSGSMTNVEFFVDGEQFGEDGESPFNATWSAVVSGVHRFTAVGKDTAGLSYTSAPVAIAIAVTLVPFSSVWKYLDNGSDQGTAWVAPDFNDSSWTNGPAELGYGDGDEATVVSFGPDANNKYITTYFRRTFEVTNAASLSFLILRLLRDDAGVVYLNGVEVFRSPNMPAGPVNYLTRPDNGPDNTVDLAGLLNTLVEGTNVLAVEIHQDQPGSSDISFDLELSAIPTIPRNLPPLVNLTSPTNGESFLAPASITLTASATDGDPDGRVAKVEFFADGMKLGETTNSPYSLVWSNVAIGWHVLHASATDDQGASAVSGPIVIAVYDAAGTPLAQIISPSDGAVTEGPTNLAITAIASAPAGVTNVEFFAGTNLIGSRSGATAIEPKADYQFQNSLSSSVGTAPDLGNLGPNTFGTATVDGMSRAVLRFAANDGLSLSQVSSVVPSNIYTAVILFSFNEVTGWRRVIDFKNGTSDFGLYVLNSNLFFYPVPSGLGSVLPPDTFVQIALTRDSSSNVVGYVDGVEQFAFVDSSDFAALDTNDVLRFFRDDGAEGSAGGVARIRLYDVALSPAEVAALDRLPNTGPIAAYSIVWSNAAFGTNVLAAVAIDANGARGTSGPVTVTITVPPTNTVAPTVAAVNPQPGATIGTLTTVQVTFSERVVGVDAADLLVNGVPATQVSGSGSNYTFTVLQPAHGTVNLTWAAGHGITDIGFPSNLPFDETGPGATWTYNLVDLTPPTVVAQNPPAFATVTNLTQISVTFDEPVTGVDAADLLINNTPAISLNGGGATYTFSFSQPPSGLVNVSWAVGHGIADLAAPPNAFNPGAGPVWAYFLDARTILVQSNSQWLFIKGTNEASTPISAWRQLGFDDSGWSNALAPFYYGDPYNTPANPGTLLSDMRGGYNSIYLRQQFVVPNLSAVTNLLLSYQSDDGFIAWINGVEVFRYNMNPGDIPYNGSSPTAIQEAPGGGAPYLNVELAPPEAYLVEGANVLAVHAFNNQPQTSSDFGFNAQLYTYLADPTVVAPRVFSVNPPAGDLFYLTNVTVRFSEPVSGVEAGDLLVNGVPAVALSSTTNTTYTFSFTQPAYGSVSISWAAGHGIADFDTPPKPFDGAAPGSTFRYSLLNPSAPTVASQSPLAGASINHLTEVTVTFSEPVTGVDAEDLRINGAPATGLSGAGATYTFTFPQPPYGPVSLGWSANHGIQDLEVPANPFDPTRPSSSWTYTLVDQTPPAIASQDPPTGALVTNLTQITITFTEPVAGVNAADLLVNGLPASSVSGSGATYTFTFAQPNATVVNVTWANNHGLRDLAPVPNTFDATAPGATWSYTTPDTVAPMLAGIDPPPFVTVRSLTQIRVTFTEPVSGVGASDLLINNRRANQVSGSGAGPYSFTFVSPSNGPVDVRWSSTNDIADLATPPNIFTGGEWTYTLDPNASFAGKIIINEIMFNPPSGRVADEWIELHNVTTGLVNVAGWRFTRGVDFTFPNVAIPAGGYLVAAADVAAFRSNYPTVTNVVGGWAGRLANNDETIEFATALDEVVNSVHYASEGDWARRERGRGAQLVTRITRNGDTATVTIFGHGYTGNDQVLISGADQPEYNGRFTLNNVGSSTFNITVPGAPASPATGTILCRQVLDDGSSGWSWFCAADGFGSSLELINPALPNSSGQNWLASTNVNGTPGRANSALASHIAPLLLDVTHFPPVPSSSDPVAITARVRDESGSGAPGLQLFYRDHTTRPPPAFSSTNMFDDGRHGDGVSGDGLFGAVLPPFPHGTIIEFYLQATNAPGLARTWPAPAWDTNGLVGQFANALYQVDNEVITNLMPAIRIVMTDTEDAIFPPNARNSDAEMNVTMISSDGDGTSIRYLCGVRIRGAGSRTRNPPNNRLNIPNDNRFNGLSAINLNGQFVHAQLMGSVVAQKSGLPAADAHVIQYRINAVNPAPITPPNNGTGQGAGYGTFLLVEPVNGDLAADLFPEDGDGNVYRASTGNHNADLTYRGADPSSYLARGYFKTSNQSENDWTDLMSLTFAFSQVGSDADYFQAVSTNANVEFWMRYFAVGTLVNFGETSLFNGRGDDYALYRGLNDPRFVLIGHDFDTIFGQGDTFTYYPTLTNASIFIMLNPPNPNPNVATLRRFMTNAAFAPIFYGELKRLTDTAFHPSQLNPLMDQLLTGWGVGPSTATIEAMKIHASNRRDNVLAQIPLALRVNHTLPIQNGYPATTTPGVTLFGTSHAIDTRKVLVNGSQATWSAWEATWAHTVTLQPGINRVLVQSLDSNDVEFARTTLDIWYDDGSVQNVSGTISADTAWSAAGGPYQVSANLTVAGGATLTIQPGTTVYLDSGVDIAVANGGRLLAEGTDTARILFTRAPGSAGTWGGITVNGGPGSPETRIAYAHFDFNGDTAIHSTDGTVFLDHLTFGNTARQYVSLDRSSFVVQDCVFPNATAAFELVHGTGGIKADGRGLFLRNYVGRAIGYNDPVDFTGGNRPGPIIQFINNVFMGSDDDLLDLDSTDAWIEGNIFLHVHRNGSPDSASAISGGADNADTSQITAIGNLFYDVDQVANAKQGNFYTLINNTIVHQTRQGSQDAETAVVILADEGTVEGAGIYLEGNIIYDAEQLVRNHTAALVTYTNNIIHRLTGAPWTGPGGNNSTNDPLLKYIPQLAETTNFATLAEAQVMRDWFSLRPGSPAIGAGPNGRDLGASQLKIENSQFSIFNSATGVKGVSISGEPLSPTPRNSATLTVGVNRTGNGIPTAGFPEGSGYTHYRWRLDGGTWSAERPISTPISLSGLANGPHYVEVSGRRDSGLYQDDPALGADAVVTVSRTWTVNSSLLGLRLNELLAANSGAVNHEGTTPDLIELYNDSGGEIDLAGVRLTDDPQDPDKFIFPADATLLAGGYLVVYANDPDGTPGYHLGFGLNQDGDAIYLYDTPERGGALLDAVAFGPQVTDLSIGLLADGSWALTVPTFAGPNRAAPVGDPRALRINEWLALGQTPFNNDFVELHNADPLPVSLGGLYLSDEIVGWSDRHQIAPLSFIAGYGYLRFFADSDAGQGPEHLSFGLSGDGGDIALYLPDLTPIDCVAYPPQFPNVSQGRSPNGSTIIVFFDQPTPGAPNPLVSGPGPFGGALVINEVLALNATLVEAEGRTPDWIELYNGTTNRIDPAGLSLTDDAGRPKRWVFPAGFLLEPGDHFRIRCDGGLPATTDTAYPPNTGFGLSASGGSVYLFDAPANGGSFLNSITYGIQAADLSIGRVPDGSTNWVLTSPTPATANVAVPTLGDPANLRVNEWLADPLPGEDDWFEVYNPNPQPAALGGLHLTDDLNNRTKHRIAPLSFLGIGTNAWLRFVADGNTGAGADHVNFSLRGAGEAVGISTAGGLLIDGNAFGAQEQNVSEGRFPDGSTNVVRFPGTASPGAANYRWLAEVVINEVLTHTDEPLEDAIELHNLTGQPVDVSGWWLSDDPGTLQKFQIPSPTLLPAHGFAVIYQSQFTNRELAAIPFALSSKGDEVVLSAVTNGALTGYRTSVRFGAADNGVSFGRYLNSQSEEQFVALSARTFGVDDPATVEQFREGGGATNAYPRVGPVVLSEIMYHPPDDGTNDNVADEFIELHNLTTVPVALRDTNQPPNVWHLRDAVDFDFPADTVLEAGGFLLVVSFDPVKDPTALASFRSKYLLDSSVPIVGPYSGKLANSSDEIELRKPGEPETNDVPYVLVERVRYSDSAPWPAEADGVGASLQRLDVRAFGNDPENWFASLPGPGLPSQARTPPTLTPIDDQTVPEFRLIKFQATVLNGSAPPESLTFSLDPGAPAGATISTDGQFRWRPSEAQGPGEYSITVRVTDDRFSSLSDEETFHVTVLEVNSPPFFVDTLDKWVNAGQTVSFPTAVDRDIPVQNLAISLDPGAPAGASIDPITAMFTWPVPVDQAPGLYTLTARVTDDGTPVLGATFTFKIHVFGPTEPLVHVRVGRAGNMAQLSWTSTPGKTYQVQTTANFDPAGWTSFGPPVVADGPFMALTVPMTGPGYFRVLELP